MQRRYDAPAAPTFAVATLAVSRARQNRFGLISTRAERRARLEMPRRGRPGNEVLTQVFRDRETSGLGGELGGLQSSSPYTFDSPPENVASSALRSAVFNRGRQASSSNEPPPRAQRADPAAGGDLLGDQGEQPAWPPETARAFATEGEGRSGGRAYARPTMGVATCLAFAQRTTTAGPQGLVVSNRFGTGVGADRVATTASLIGNVRVASRWRSSRQLGSLQLTGLPARTGTLTVVVRRHGATRALLRRRVALSTRRRNVTLRLPVTMPPGRYHAVISGPRRGRHHSYPDRAIFGHKQSLRRGLRCVPGAHAPQGDVVRPCRSCDASVRGLGGDDRLDGFLGDDCLYGGAGGDQIIGDKGADVLDGGDGNDVITGGDGKDRQFGGPGRDVINDGREA